MRVEKTENPRVVLSRLKQELTQKDAEGGFKNIRQLQSGAVIVESHTESQQQKLKNILKDKNDITIKTSDGIDNMFMVTGIEKGYEAKEFIVEVIRLTNEIEAELNYSVTDKIKPGFSNINREQIDADESDTYGSFKQMEEYNRIALLHQNVQSLGNSINEVNQMIANNSDCKLICITEHWKSQNQIINYAIRNFKLASYFCRKLGKHGGSAVYVRVGVQCSERLDIKSLSVEGSLECAAVKCSLYGFNFIMLSIYRPPSGNKHVFLEKMERILLKIRDDSATIFIAGDFNIDFSQESLNKQLLCSLLNSYDLHQTIFQYTRITSTSGTCIDNIFTNTSTYVSNVINSLISDHTAQKITMKVNRNNLGDVIQKRIFSSENKEFF
ncbi:unnamed protein product [Acanthoscelides obtectus]|uniref:Endonuclease/exonuclease/phosphatase domain-containing protein n=1 Tax=Acanthoscelides obtectus TaxID=200917 RepID=A0A9P0M6A9_ACAOB|nr:unnamed protein product [Acanthoscelides obtectus]CAK1670202.1 hypothetical protein AOBTE_LOCUS27469 [Acanthoscelides obtectus]